ncbi:hypothetical protein ACI6PS_01235 [Flavobacterium sp. PLA-1-15]|uniref:hypothetical protein n=1 Tax=Flavobacterium sp. PLA-1-15 TaxID=3380533 RepID=UPI003B7CFB96
MKTKELRRKLMTDFGKILEDESKLDLLESVFDAIIKEDKNSSIPESHYLKVEEARENYLSDKNSGISWDDFENELNSKYGF